MSTKFYTRAFAITACAAFVASILAARQSSRREHERKALAAELETMVAERSAEDTLTAEIDPLPMPLEPTLQIVHVTWDTIFEICDGKYKLAEVRQGFCFLLPVGSEGLR